MILADTSIWVPFLRREWDRPKVAEFRALLHSRELATTGLVIAEVLQGTRGQQRSEVEEVLFRMPYLETTKEAWIAAGDLSQQLYRQGLPTPLSDLIIAQVALTSGCSVLEIDGHFSRVPGIKLHGPTSADLA